MVPPTNAATNCCCGQPDRRPVGQVAAPATGTILHRHRIDEAARDADPGYGCSCETCNDATRSRS